MRSFYSVNFKEAAISLRKSGKSYSDIKKIFNIKSKGTLSLWFKNLKLTKKENEKLFKNVELAKTRGLLKFNKNRTEKILKENEIFFKEASNLINPISKNELFLVGISLYWGEGTKSERHGPSVTFSNSDPLMVAMFMRFVREILNVKEEKIRSGIQIHPNISESKAREFWAKVTKLPEERFYITKQISRVSKLKRPINFLPFGTIAIRVNNRQLFYKMRGYISGLAKQSNYILDQNIY